MASRRPYGPHLGPRIGRGDVAPAVFYPALTIIGVAVVVAMVFPDTTGDFLAAAQRDIVSSFGWFYVALVAVFIGFSLWMGLSRFGDVKLGSDDSHPEFSLGAWFAMLFAAGMGIGLVFWGAAEPLTYFNDPKPGVEGDQTDLAQIAMAQTFLHWGFHAWGVYVVVGLSLAYAIHRKGRPVSIRWALEPLLGARVRGRLGDAVDIVAIVGTVFGVATSLGLGVQQIGAGLVHMGVVDSAGKSLHVVIIVAVTAVAVLSVASGVGKGIKWLSNANLVLAAVFLAAVLLLGPTLFLLREWVQSLGVYLENVLELTFDTSAFTGAEGQEWQGLWSTFYWSWWISWAPFVGLFIARISKGRTIREFVAGVLLVPTAVTFLWFAVMGGSAIHRQMFGAGGLVDDGVVVPENVVFDLVGDLPLGGLLSVIVVILVAVFFVTSSDSGSFVVDMLASGGDPNPPIWSRILWAVLEGLVAVALLLAGGLGALRTGSIMTALPFTLVMIGMCISTYRALKAEHRILLDAERRQRREELARQILDHVTEDLTEHFGEHFGEHVDRRISEVLSGDGVGDDGGGEVREDPRRHSLSHHDSRARSASGRHRDS